MITRQRLVLALAFLVCVGMMGSALFFQYVLQLEPCPLCILQRVAVISLGAVFLVGLLHNPRGWGRRVYGALAVLVASSGLGIAARHVWLQQLPADQVPSCGPGLSYILEAFPLLQGLKMVLSGSGECAEVLWTFLGVSIPGWTTVAFFAFVGFSLYLVFAPAGERLGVKG